MVDATGRTTTTTHPGPLTTRSAAPDTERGARPGRATAACPKRHGAGLSPYRVVRELQALLATWAGASPTCHRDIPIPAPT